MADYVGNAFAYLIAQSSAWKTTYFPKVSDILQRHGKLQRLMPKTPHVLDGPSEEFTAKTAHNRTTRVTMDPMEAMPDPGPGRYCTFPVTWDHSDGGASNDFMMTEIAWRTTIFDMKKKGDRAFKGGKDPIATDFEEGLADVKETYTKYFFLPTDGKLCTLHATASKKADDTDNWTGASVYGAGATHCRLRIADNSIARIGIGQIVEIRTTAGVLIVNNLRVINVHSRDQTFDVELLTGERNSVDGGDVDVANLDDITHGYYVYLSGNYNVGVTGSLAHFFDDTATYYTRTRTDSPYQVLMPLVHALGTDIALTEKHIVEAGIAAQWAAGDSNAKVNRVMCMARDQWWAMRNLARDSNITMSPGTGDGLKRNIGEVGYKFYDPAFGDVPIVVEDFAEYGEITLLDMNTWLLVHPFAGGGFQMLPGDVGGMWTRNTENDGSGRPSKIWSAQGMQAHTYVNLGARKNIQLQGLDPAAG